MNKLIYIKNYKMLLLMMQQKKIEEYSLSMVLKIDQ